MRSMMKNETGFWYALFDRAENIIDEDGHKSAEKELIYHNPVYAEMNVSPPSGPVAIRAFGLKEDYDRILVSCDLDIPITSTSVLWVDTPPVINPDGSTDTPYDYVVKKVAPSLNVLLIAISKVSVGE